MASFNPTQWNPYGVTSLADMQVAHVADLVQNHWSQNTSICATASELLPLSNLTMLNIQLNSTTKNITVKADPTTLDVGYLDIWRFAQATFPSNATDGADMGDILKWWSNATINDKASFTNFLTTVVKSCHSVYCQSPFLSVGNPDIVGIGMLVATVMLLFLALGFSLLSFAPIADMISRKPVDDDPEKKAAFNFRAACIGTVDELFSAVFVFGLSVIVSTFIFRYSTDARFDILMADGLSLFCSTTIVMIAATYWKHSCERPHASFSVGIVAILTVVLFATHFNVTNTHASPVELACGTGSGLISSTDSDPFDQRHFRFVPIGFSFWVVALVGAVCHHPKLHPYRPSWAHGWIWTTFESLPLFFGFASLIIYAAYFFSTWKMMKETYGQAFTHAEETWAFGQILAVFTWLPPILAFFHLFFGKQTCSVSAHEPS
jgi:hypothetical protein